MISRYFAVLMFLTVQAMGGVIAEASSTDETCGPQSQGGEFAVAASIVCSGSFATAGAIFTPNNPAGDYALEVSGGKEAGAPSVSAVAGFDDWLMVNGAGASGYLRVSLSWAPPLTIVAPSRIQGGSVTFMGNNLASPFPTPYFYFPFTAGVPVHIYGTLHGFAGTMDRLDTPGEFYSTLTVYLRVTSEIVADPIFENPMYVPGASVTAIPEPRVWMMVVIGLAVVRLGRGRRASCGWLV